MTKSPHFWWIICLLGATIICLLAFIISERILCSNELMEYISVCSIILSITLSILAIQYTYTSNNEIHQQFKNINSVADNIKETAKSLADTNALLNQNMDQILNRLEYLNTSQEVMRAQLKDIQNTQVVKTAVKNFEETHPEAGQRKKYHSS